MNLSSMLKREDFFPSFFETVKKFYSEVYGYNIDIDFSDKKNCNLVIKPFLSAATSPRMSEKARKFFYNEWNIRDSLIKNMLAKLGVFFLTHSGKAFSQFTFCMKPEMAATRDLVIAPNNRSIRFFDYSTGTVGCIIKQGFTKKYFSNQLEFRKKYKYSFMLPMIKWGEDWFVEPILDGHPLARVTDNKLHEKGISDALIAIRQLANDTPEYIDANIYVNEIHDKIKALLDEAEHRKNITSTGATKQIAEKAVNIVLSQINNVPVCQSHGDFQEGNIWVDNNKKTWIYDWETAGRRSIWYDSAVLCYSLRRANGWKKLAEKSEPKEMLNCDPIAKPSIEEYKAMKAIVLLEDILFYLEDMLELPNDWGKGIYDSFIERITTINI